MRRILPLALGVPLLAACAQRGPTWVHVAAAKENAHRARPDTYTIGPLEVSLRDGADGYRLTTTIAADEWRSDPEHPGRWETPQRLLGIGTPPGGDPPYGLTEGEHAFVYERDEARLEDGGFGVSGGRIRLQRDADAGPPREVSFSAVAAHRSGTEEARAIAGRRFSGEGLVVWPEERLELLVDVPPASALRFATTVETALVTRELRGELHTFRVYLDDVQIFEFEQETQGDSAVWHTVPLPPGGGSGLRLAFEVEGPFAYTAFHSPVVGPAEIGLPRSRPWGTRPDVVVFLADTFRADNLGFYGSARGLTPNIDRFAERSRSFRNAWSVSTHTLAAHSSIFAGTFPRQNGLLDFWNPLPSQIDTLAEILARRGYRTAAVTDGIMLSRTHGMAQGFEWFDERGKGLDATLARTRLALGADDGRPLFLFVQTYATHAPYRIRPTAVERVGDRLDLSGDFDTLLYSLERKSPDSSLVDLSREGASRAVEGLRQLYLGSVADLDDGFGAFQAQLDEAGLSDAYLVFTSDHGEAFCEHGEIFHGGATHEEQLRVPLLLHGPGVRPGLVEHPASLIDLAPTILGLVGLTPPPTWEGTSLVTLDTDRPIFAFQCRDALPDSTLAVIDGPRKLIGLEEPEPPGSNRWREAYSLDRDPGETENLWGTSISWPQDVAARFTRTVEELSVPLVKSGELHLTEDERARIEEMGYGGGE